MQRPDREWTKLVSRHSKRHYYYNVRTGESTWRAPTSKIAGHYNRVAGETAEQRKSDDMLSVRNFHNWLKNSLIRQHCRAGYSVLDLCCGKGGDIFKYKHLGISGYTGVDFAAAAVQTARARASSVAFPIELCVEDLRRPLQLRDPSPRDVVSAQFCLHYFWSSENVASTFLESAARHLKPGGRLIATFTDEAVLRITASTERRPGSAGNPLYQLRMGPAREGAAGGFGQCYYFSSGSTVRDSEEYMVPLESLCAVASKHGLDLLESQNFHHYAYDRMCDEREEQLLEKFRVPPCLTRDEWEVSRNYRVAVFAKRGSTKRPTPSGGD